MFVVFEICEVKYGPVLTPKIPYYVTYDPQFVMYRQTLLRSTFLILKLITKCLWLKRYVIFTSSPFRSLIKGASPFFLMSFERSSKTTPLLLYMLSQNIDQERDIAEKHRKNRTLFQTRFSSPTALRRFLSQRHETQKLQTSTLCLLSVKI